MNWKDILLNLFDDSIKNEIITKDKNTYTLNGKDVFKDFMYKGKVFTLRFVYRYAYISIDDRPKYYLYDVDVFDRENSWEYLFHKTISINDKLKDEDFKEFLERN